MQLFIRSNVSINKLSVHYCFQKFWIKKNCEIKYRCNDLSYYEHKLVHLPEK